MSCIELHDDDSDDDDNFVRESFAIDHASEHDSDENDVQAR